MKFRDSIQPALVGLVAGAVVVAVAGLSLGVVVTSSKANDMAVLQSARTVAQIMTPYCVAAAKADPNYTTLFDKMKAGTAYIRTQVVTEAGWATPMGAEKPHATLANACQQAIMGDL